MGTVILLLTAAVFCNSQISDKHDYLSKEQTKFLKGIFALIVLIHHLGDYVTAGGIPALFKTVGYVAVGFFFFVSAYGSVVQLKKQESLYVKTFAGKKLLNVILPYLEVTVIYWLYLVLAEGRDLSFPESLLKAFSIKHIASNCWYMVALIYFFAAFGIGAWAAMKTKKYPMSVIISTLVYLLAYYGYYHYHNAHHPESVIGLHWVYSTMVLFAGVLWGCFGEKLKQYLGGFCLAAALTAAGIWLYERVTNDRWSIELHNISALAYVIMVLYASKWIKLGNRFLDLMGDISFELYMIHGLVIKVCVRYLGTERQTVFGVAVLVLSILAAWLLHKAFTLQKRGLNRLPAYGRKLLGAKSTAADLANNR